MDHSPWGMHATRIREVSGSILRADQSTIFTELPLATEVSAGFEFSFHLSLTFVSVVVGVCVISRRWNVLSIDLSRQESLYCSSLSIQGGREISATILTVVGDG